LGEIGEVLRDEVHSAVRNFVARLRSDPATPLAAALRQPAVEDHTVTFLADIAQALIIIDHAEGQVADLLNDATEVQRTISERHGVRRRRQGWSEASITREFQILFEEVARVLRHRIPGSSKIEEAMTVLRRLIERAAEISRQSWREAGRRDASV
jgi:hypothetical protein